MATHQQNFGFLLRAIARLYALRFSELAQELSLSLPECRVLGQLEQHDGTTQVKLAELTHLEPMSLVRILDRMELGGLIIRRADSNDRRLRRIFLTARAKSLLTEVRVTVDRTDDAAFAHIEDQERARFMQVLGQIQANLSEPLDSVKT